MRVDRALHLGGKLLGIVQARVDVDADRLVGIIDIHKQEVLAPIDVRTGIAGLASGFELKRVVLRFQQACHLLHQSRSWSVHR